jgi:hypothetical protein
MSILLAGLIGAVAPAGAAGGNSIYIEVGGIPSSQQNASPGSDQGRRIDKPQTGLGNLSVPSTSPNTGRHFDNPVSGGGNSLVPNPNTLFDKPQTGGGGTTLPFSNSGTFPAGSTNLGQPFNQFCSSSDVTIGENTQSRLHCSNTVGGSLRQ